jgi:hypothetical protein
MPVLAHAGQPDELVAEFLVLGAVVLGWVGIARIRGRGFRWMPAAAGWGILAGALALLVLAVLVPTVLWTAPGAVGDRPAPTASLRIVAPVEAQEVLGTTLDVVTELTGARVVDGSITEVTPDTGHIHVYLDDRLMSMAYADEQEIPIDWLERGPHILRVEFVAADHIAFDPPVEASVTFVKLTA